MRTSASEEFRTRLERALAPGAGAPGLGTGYGSGSDGGGSDGGDELAALVRVAVDLRDAGRPLLAVVPRQEFRTALAQRLADEATELAPARRQAAAEQVAARRAGERDPHPPAARLREAAPGPWRRRRPGRARRRGRCRRGGGQRERPAGRRPVPAQAPGRGPAPAAVVARVGPRRHASWRWPASDWSRPRTWPCWPQPHAGHRHPAAARRAGTTSATARPRASSGSPTTTPAPATPRRWPR